MSDKPVSTVSARDVWLSDALGVLARGGVPVYQFSGPQFRPVSDDGFWVEEVPATYTVTTYDPAADEYHVAQF